jgi:hypothetical protein
MVLDVSEVKSKVEHNGLIEVVLVRHSGNQHLAQAREQGQNNQL